MDKRYFTIAEAAEYLCMSYEAVRRCIENESMYERIPPFILMANNKYKVVRFDKLDMDAWMDSKKNRKLEA